jgi:putative addiction module component (TIGR02574 family)
MSLAEVLPNVRSLSRLDKIRLIQLLAQELEQDEACLIEPGRSYPVQSPNRAYAAAAALLQALEEEQTPIPETQRQELERRLADSQARPAAVTPWEEIKARALARARE